MESRNANSFAVRLAKLFTKIIFAFILAFSSWVGAALAANVHSEARAAVTLTALSASSSVIEVYWVLVPVVVIFALALAAWMSLRRRPDDRT